jgi:cysteine sulfinate desulfinase/cysteine desulfurase-like protein
MAEQSPSQYIVAVKYGDPNTNQALKTALGIFNTREEADLFIRVNYQDTNHICDVLPLNILEGES